MCGFTGVYLADGRCDPQVLERMRDQLSHRGPDDAGSMTDGPVGLAHRRLSIIDLSTGHQPMTTTDGRYTIVYNGEIYNYRELRKELEQAAVQFQTHSDTEVILLLHAHFGDEAAVKLNGMFAYALWDRVEQRLLLVRDRLGIKPLHFAQTSAGIAFGSEIKTLFTSGLVQPRVDFDRVAEYLLYRQVAGTGCLFAGVQSVVPGSIVEIRNGKRLGAKTFWNPRDRVREYRGAYPDAVEELDKKLNAAVKGQMVADVPLGTFCSGGIDSSLVSAMASRYCSGPLNTFSVAFDEPEFDERVYAQMVSRALGTNHTEIVVSEKRFAELLPNLIWHHDLPLHFANSVQIFAISEVARSKVKVVLTGEGADELFGGYPRYYLPRLNNAFGHLPQFVQQMIGKGLGLMPGHRAAKTLAVLGQPLAQVLMANAAVGNTADLAMLRRPAGDFPFREALVRSVQERGYDPVAAALEVDLETYLVALLERQDRMSMAASIESRVPFLDNNIIEFARRLPTGYKQTARRRKRVLMEVAARYLPREIVERKKAGFGVPLGKWFSADGGLSALADQAVNSSWAGDWELRDGMATLLRSHRAGAGDHSDTLWSLVNLYLWNSTYIDGQHA